MPLLERLLLALIKIEAMRGANEVRMYRQEAEVFNAESFEQVVPEEES